ncbi:MAG: DMT family transporter [Paracoccaceae bacterium]
MSPNQRGILLMTLSMAGFSVTDAVIKLASDGLPVAQVLLAFGGGGAVIMALMGLIRRRRVWTGAALHPHVMLRNGMEMLGTWGGVMALSLLPLTTAASIMQVAPLFYTAAAAIFLGEAVGWRRWMAILVGFAGVMLIIRPGTDAFDWAALWAIGSVIALTVRDIATRRLPATIDDFSLTAFAYASVLILALILLAIDPVLVTPSPQQMVWLIASSVFGVCSYWCMTGALRTGDVGVVTPFRFTRLLFAIGIGLAFFGERLDPLTIVGSVLVVASGIYTLWRERLRKQALPMGQASG